MFVTFTWNFLQTPTKHDKIRVLSGSLRPTCELEFTRVKPSEAEKARVKGV